MISEETHISVGIIRKGEKVFGTCKGNYIIGEGMNFSGAFSAEADGDVVVLRNGQMQEISRGHEIVLHAQQGASFILNDVAIGIQFHWQRNEDQEFEGDLRLCAFEKSIAAINDIGLEQYLKSVISSEMSANAPIEFLKGTCRRITKLACCYARSKGKNFRGERECSKGKMGRQGNRAMVRPRRSSLIRCLCRRSLSAVSRNHENSFRFCRSSGGRNQRGLPYA